MTDPRKEYEAVCARLHSADFHGDPFDRDDVRKLGHAYATLEATITDLLDVVEAAGIIAANPDDHAGDVRRLKQALAKPSIQAALKERRGL